jgi:hypothetical protein
VAEPWSPALEHYSSYRAEQLVPYTSKLATLLKAAPEAKLKVSWLRI